MFCDGALTPDPCHMFAVPACHPAAYLSGVAGLFPGEFMGFALFVHSLAPELGYFPVTLRAHNSEAAPLPRSHCFASAFDFMGLPSCISRR